MRRAHAVIAATLLAVGGVAAPAGAVVADGCDPSSDRYVPGEGCEVQVNDVDYDCVNGIPQLTYDLSVRGVRADSVDIIWRDAAGTDRVTYAGARLAGTVNWPGASVSATGTPTDWPGWTQRSDGRWVQGDEFDWATGAVDVVFSVPDGPRVTVDATYPDQPECRPASAVLANNPGTRTNTPVTTRPRATGLSGVLAATGVEASTLALGAGALLVGGTSLVLVRRGRRDGVAE